MDIQKRPRGRPYGSKDRVPRQSAIERRRQSSLDRLVTAARRMEQASDGDERRGAAAVARLAAEFAARSRFQRVAKKLSLKCESIPDRNLVGEMAETIEEMISEQEQARQRLHALWTSQQ